MLSWFCCRFLVYCRCFTLLNVSLDMASVRSDRKFEWKVQTESSKPGRFVGVNVNEGEVWRKGL